MVTGGGSGQHDLAWLRAQIRDGERVTITERTGSLFCLGLWGPRARDVLSAVTDADVSNEAFPYMTARYLNVGEVGPVWAQRISYAGELGWELYGQFAMGDRAWDLLWEAGREHGLIAAGGGAFDSLAAGEGLPAVGPGHPHRARPVRGGPRLRGPDGTRSSRAGRRWRRSATPAAPPGGARMVFDDPRTVVMGKEPIRHDGRVVSYVTSAAYGYSGRPRHRLRLSAVGPCGGRHAGRGRVLRRAPRRHREQRAAVGSQGRTAEELRAKEVA